MLVVLERDVRQLQSTLALDVDLLRPVDHELGDRVVAQERLERAEAQDLVRDLLEHPHALGAGEGQALLVRDLAEELLDLTPDLNLVGEVELRVELIDHPVLNSVLRLAEGLACRQRAQERASDRRRRVGGWRQSRGLSAGAGCRRGGRRHDGCDRYLSFSCGTGPLDPLQQ